MPFLTSGSLFAQTALRSQLAIEAIDQGFTVLVRLLVVPESPDLVVGKAVYPSGDLIHVHLVVAGNREGGRLRGPLDAPGGGVHRARCGVGHRSHHARSGLPARHRPGPVLGEGGVEEVHVGSERFLCPRPSGLLLPVGLLGESLGTRAAGLGLLPEVAGAPLTPWPARRRAGRNRRGSRQSAGPPRLRRRPFLGPP